MEANQVAGVLEPSSITSHFLGDPPPLFVSKHREQPGQGDTSGQSPRGRKGHRSKSHSLFYSPSSA